MRHASLLLFAFLGAAAMAQTPAPAAPTADDAELRAARAKPCGAFLSEVTRYQAAGGEPGRTPSFALIWGALLKADPKSGEYMGKMGLGRFMFDNTMVACQRMRERTLGATMDAEYAAL
jgi:hypothetical protein